MRSIGRLWRRAPAWRLLLFAAVACTALAAMFPPATPRWARRDDRPLAAPWHGSQAHFAPPPATRPPDYAMTEQPPPGIAQSGVIPVAGRQLPLPAGNWQTLWLARAAGPDGVQLEILGRIVGQTVTGLMLTTAPDALAGGLPPALVLQPCDTNGTIASEAAPAVATDPFLHECWTLGGMRVALGGRAEPGALALPHLERLIRAGVTVPGHMIALRYSRSDQVGWFAVLLLLPDGAPPRRLAAWAHRYAVLLHRGYDGGLAKSVVVRDPE